MADKESRQPTHRAYSVIKREGQDDYSPNRGELRVSTAAPREFAVWKTVKLGTCETLDEYRKALKKAGYRIGDWGNDILGRINCVQLETEADLVVLSVKELGYDGAYYKDICDRGVEMGLELCPAEVGPALRLSYKDQPRDEWLRIAMEAITVTGGDRLIFAVGCDRGGLWLRGDGHPVVFWRADGRFVFVRRKS